MEHPLVIGILDIVEDKLREFNIRLPDEFREEHSNDPIVGYQYAELHDRIMEYLEDQGVITPDLQKYSRPNIKQMDNLIRDANHAYINATIPVSELQFDFSDPHVGAVKNSVEELLAQFEDKYDLNSYEYQSATQIVEGLCFRKFPDLYDAITCKHDNDLIFSDAAGEYSLFYYNPDSVSGGQIVECYFNHDDAIRILNGENYIDVVAEHTQYLHDIDTMHYFHTIFQLVEAKNEGMYLGADIQKVCQNIVNQKENLGASLDELIENAQQRSKTVQAENLEKQPEKGDDSRE